MVSGFSIPHEVLLHLLIQSEYERLLFSSLNHLSASSASTSFPITVDTSTLNGNKPKSIATSSIIIDIGPSGRRKELEPTPQNAQKRRNNILIRHKIEIGEFNTLIYPH